MESIAQRYEQSRNTCIQNPDFFFRDLRIVECLSNLHNPEYLNHLKQDLYNPSDRFFNCSEPFHARAQYVVAFHNDYLSPYSILPDTLIHTKQSRANEPLGHSVFQLHRIYSRPLQIVRDMHMEKYINDRELLFDLRYSIAYQYMLSNIQLGNICAMSDHTRYIALYKILGFHPLVTSRINLCKLSAYYLKEIALDITFSPNIKSLLNSAERLQLLALVRSTCPCDAYRIKDAEALKRLANSQEVVPLHVSHHLYVLLSIAYCRQMFHDQKFPDIPSLDTSDGHYPMIKITIDSFINMLKL